MIVASDSRVILLDNFEFRFQLQSMVWRGSMLYRCMSQLSEQMLWNQYTRNWLNFWKHPKRVQPSWSFWRTCQSPTKIRLRQYKAYWESWDFLILQQTFWVTFFLFIFISLNSAILVSMLCGSVICFSYDFLPIHQFFHRCRLYFPFLSKSDFKFGVQHLNFT